MRDDIILEDTTLRDGEQAPGVAFPKAMKIRILDRLIAAGVGWVEVGIPAMGGEELEALKAMLERKDEAVLVGWNRGIKEDVGFSLDLGFKAVHIGLPTSQIHLADSIGKSRDWLLLAAADTVKYAKDRGAFVSISAEDVGRTEISFLQEYAGVVADAGADRLRLSDTIGILDPAGYAERVQAAAVAGIDLQCHCHNDYGLAVANTIAGLKAGARYFHVCVNGMGERAGMPDFAQMVLALRDFHRIDVGIKTSELWSLARLVAEASHQNISAWQPIVGDNVFAHESGIHTKGMIKNGKTFEPFAPEEVGGQHRLVVGKHSGRAVIKYFLQKEGVEVDEDLLGACLDEVRASAIANQSEVSPGALKAIYARIAGAAHVGAV